MKYILQMGIIFTVSFVAEVLSTLLPLPVPASIYGLVLMLILLLSGALKLGQVRESANALLTIMTVMFVPANVGLMTVKEEMMNMLLPLLVIVPVSTIAVMGATGLVADWIIRKKEARGNGTGTC